MARAEEQRDQFIAIGTMLTRMLNQKPTAAMTGYFLAKEKLEGEVGLNSSNYSFLLSRYAPTCTVIAEETAPRIDGWLSRAQNVTEHVTDHLTDHGAATELN